jgi:hypothetical protein
MSKNKSANRFVLKPILTDGLGVEWVEQSETHRLQCSLSDDAMVGFAKPLPYGESSHDNKTERHKNLS